MVPCTPAPVTRDVPDRSKANEENAFKWEEAPSYGEGTFYVSGVFTTTVVYLARDAILGSQTTISCHNPIVWMYSTCDR